MNIWFEPWQVLLVAMAGLLNDAQQRKIAFLETQVAVLETKLRRRGRIRFSDAERIRLGAAAAALGRRALREIETVVTPETLLRWYRELPVAPAQVPHAPPECRDAGVRRKGSAWASLVGEAQTASDERKS